MTSSANKAEDSEMKDVFKSLGDEFDDASAYELDEKIGKFEIKLYRVCSTIPAAKFSGTLKTLKTIVKNLLKHPLNAEEETPEKYRRLKMNGILKERLFIYNGMLELLIMIGFEKCSSDANILRMLPSNENAFLLQGALEKIIRAQPTIKEQKLTVDRQLKVYSLPGLKKFRANAIPLATTADVEEDEEDDQTSEKIDRKIQMESHQKANQRHRMINPTVLAGHELRMKQLGMQTHAYSETLIQIEFSSGYVLEGRFHPQEGIEDLYAFVNSCLDPIIIQKNMDYILIVPPHMKLKRKKTTQMHVAKKDTFVSLSMMPACTVRFKLERDTDDYTGHFISNAIISQITDNYTVIRSKSAINIGGNSNNYNAKKKNKKNKSAGQRLREQQRMRRMQAMLQRLDSNEQ